MTTIGERITRYRNRAGMTRSELAVAIGVKEAAVGHMENNRRKPSLEAAVRLANVFGVSLDDLIGTDESIFATAEIIP